MALRLTTGLKIFAADANGKTLFDECLDGSMPQADIDKAYDLLFPVPPENSPATPVRGVKVSVRTSYKGFLDARIAGSAQTPGLDVGEGTAHFPALVIDLVSETAKGSMGGRTGGNGRRHAYDQVAEVMIIAGSKFEVRALHVLVTELLLDSNEFFIGLGYIGAVDIQQSGDIRPVDAAMAGLMPNLLGMVQRYQRWKGTVVRSTPRIFSSAPEIMGTLSLHHVDSVGSAGEPGEAEPLLSDT
jgi:hypothetical protein